MKINQKNMVKYHLTKARIAQKMKFSLSIWQFSGLAFYSAAFPVGIYLQNEFHTPGALLLWILNLPFLVILAPLLMMMEPFHIGRLFGHLMSWGIIFIQSYLAFVYWRNDSERGK